MKWETHCCITLVESQPDAASIGFPDMDQVESRKERLKIADYSITQASLEHVIGLQVVPG